MKTIVYLFIFGPLFLFCSCDESKFFSTPKTTVYNEDSFNDKSINNYLNLYEIPDLRSKDDVDYSLLDYHGYNWLYNENVSENTFTNDEVFLYKGKITFFYKLFLMDDIYSNINEEQGSKGFNLKILRPFSKVTSEEILNPTYLTRVIKENPKFNKNMFLLNFYTRDNDISYVFHLIFLNNYLVEMTISERN